MKICPSCGAELDDGATKCPICEASIPGAASPMPEALIPAQPFDLSAKLSEMRMKIDQLTTRPEDKKPEPEAGPVPEERPKAPPEEPKLQEEREPTAVSEVVEVPEEGVEEEAAAEEEYEEIIVETRQIGHGVIDRDSIVNLGKPRRKIEEGSGRKISLEEARAAKKTHAGIRRSYVVAAIAIIAIVIIASFLVLANRPSIITPAVDGIWDDWNAVSKFPAYISSDNPSLNIEDTAVQYYKGSIFWYLHTTGELYKTSDRISTYALLIDSDGDSTTGFSLYSDFGADLMAMISGSGGEELSSNLYIFDSEDNLNWSAWNPLRGINVATLISQGETNFTAPAGFSSTNARFVSVALDGKSRTCMSVFFSLKPSVLVIVQGSLVPSTGVLLAEPNQHILQLIVRGYGSVGDVDSIIPTVVGADTLDLGAITWRNADEMRAGKILTLSIDCSSITSGTKISAMVEKDGIESDFGCIMITGTPAIGYIGNIPPGIIIDGIFVDWSDFELDFNDPVPPANKDVDLTRTAMADSSTDLFFFGEVFGKMLNGSIIPVKELIAGPGGIGGEVGITERASGEDVLQIYIDVDPYDDIGAPSPIANVTLEPDFMIELAGRNGIIARKTFYEWYDGRWLQDDSVEISAAVDSQRIELGLAKSAIGSLNGSDVAFVCTDWLGTKDDFAIASVAIDPFKINLQGDVWGSLDGTSWVPRADVLSTTNSLVDLTSDASGNLYAIFSNGTVYVSYDLANSWSRLISSSLANVVAITSDGIGQLYSIRSTGEAYNATLTGGSWSYRGDIIFANDIVDLDWSYGTVPGSTCLYAVRSTPNVRLVRTINGGATWAQYNNNPNTVSTVSSIAILSSGGQDVIYVLQRNGDVYVSNDSATTWTITHVSPGGSPDFSASPCVDLDIDSNGNLWVVRGQGEVYRLITSTWTWETLYGINDISDVTAISSVPIPEFSDLMPILLFCIFIPLICIHRNLRKRRIA